MKTNQKRLIVLVSLGVALLTFVVGSSVAHAQQKGAEKLVQLSAIKTVEDLQKIEPGDVIVMSCTEVQGEYRDGGGQNI